MGSCDESSGDEQSKVALQIALRDEIKKLVQTELDLTVEEFRLLVAGC
jgi:hypothetical protein